MFVPSFKGLPDESGDGGGRRASLRAQLRGSIKRLVLPVLLLLIGLIATLVITALQTPMYLGTTMVDVMPSAQDAPEEEGAQMFIEKQKVLMISELPVANLAEFHELQLYRRITQDIEGDKKMMFHPNPDKVALDRVEQVLRKRIRVDQVSNTSLLKVSYWSETPRSAASGANTLVYHYVEQRRDAVAKRRGWKLDELSMKGQSLEQQLKQLTEELAIRKRKNEAQVTLDSMVRRQEQTKETLAEIKRRIVDVELTSLGGAGSPEIFGRAEAPARAAKPNRPVWLASGTVLSLMLSIGLFFLLKPVDQEIEPVAGP